MVSCSEYFYGVIAEARKEIKDGSEEEGGLEKGKMTHWFPISIFDYLDSSSNEMTLAFILK